MALHQHFKSGLDIGALGIGFKAEHVERSALGIEHLAALGRRTSPTATSHPLEQPKGIVGRPTGTAGAAGAALAVAATSSDRAHFPGRTVPSKVFFLIFRDRVVAHALEKIIRIVVFADMIQAETPIFRRAQPALRRAMGGGRVATRPFAAWKLGAQPAILIGLYPDAIKEGRVITYWYDYAGACMAPSRLDRRQKRACGWD